MLAAVVAGLTIAAALRRGAFHPVNAFGVGVAALVVAGLRLGLRVDRRAKWVAAALGALAVWWFVVADIHGTPASFLPLGASMLGFLAAFLVMRHLGADRRPLAALVFALIGAGASAVGLVAVVVRWFPMAERAQNLWRLSTVLTYSNAAGLMLAMALLVGLGLDLDRRLARVAVCLCLAGLMATESRGAALALVLAIGLVPWAQLRSAIRPLALGAVAGAVVVATATGDAARPLTGLVVLVAVLAAAFVPPGTARRRPGKWLLIGGAAAAVALLAAAGFVLRVPIARRLNNDRTPEWSAAVAQWRSSPVVGVGPDKPLLLDAATRTITSFAHNEYLQVTAGGGLLAAGLLVLVALSLASVVRRVDAGTSCAAAALVAFAVAGAFDFTWHLPALGLMAGWAAGLAGTPGPAPGRVPPTTPVPGQAENGLGNP